MRSQRKSNYENQRYNKFSWARPSAKQSYKNALWWPTKTPGNCIGAREQSADYVFRRANHRARFSNIVSSRGCKFFGVKHVNFLTEISTLSVQPFYQVVQIIKSLATAGRTIVCTIHQPSARLFEVFDDLYLLTGGQCIYTGSVPELNKFLTTHGLACPDYHNPADFAIEIASGEFGPERLAQLILSTSRKRNIHEIENYGNSSMGMDSTGQLSEYNCYTAPAWKQFWILFQRQLVITVRDPMVTHLRLISHIAISLLFGGINYQIGNDAEKAHQNVSFIFLCIIFLV